MENFEVNEIVNCFVQKQSTAEEIDIMMLITSRMGLTEARNILMLAHLCKTNKVLAKRYLKENSWLANCISYDTLVVGDVVRRISDCICDYVNKNDGI